MEEKNRDLYGGMVMMLFSGILATAVLVKSWFENSETDKYIITGKCANKIEYCSINNARDSHVMIFNANAEKMAPDWWPYINVGDTLIGIRKFMMQPVCSSVCRSKWTLYPVIQYANGKSLDELRALALRDSLLREIKCHQK